MDDDNDILMMCDELEHMEDDKDNMLKVYIPHHETNISSGHSFFLRIIILGFLSVSVSVLVTKFYMVF